jgi:enterochelin esterase-like enzyme
MGGFAALRLAGKYPSRVAGAAAHSAITEIVAIDPLIAEARTSWSRAPSDLSVATALLMAPGPLPPLRFDCGTEDKLLTANRRLDRLLVESGIRHTYAEGPGGHDWTYWRRELAASLRFFGAILGPR